MKTAFVWENFGPMHADRCQAVARYFFTSAAPLGIELFSRSDTYEWQSEAAQGFEKTTLFTDGNWAKTSTLRLAGEITATCRKSGATHIFLCHYDQPAILLAAMALRLTGRQVFAMACSKFDDVARSLPRETLKRLFFLPYHGAISSGERAKDYLRLMGIPKSRIVGEYNTLSVERIRRLAGADTAPSGTAFGDRHFSIVARLVGKKNLPMALEAYALYHRCAMAPRDLHICGSGPLEPLLRTQVDRLGISTNVVFHGFVQTAQVARLLGRTLALILPSTEEQFGNVVIEAQAMGVPAIVSERCGARDHLVRQAVNGFIIEPDNPVGLARLLTTLGTDKALWADLCRAALKSAPKGDACRFAEGVGKLVT